MWATAATSACVSATRSNRLCSAQQEDRGKRFRLLPDEDFFIINGDTLTNVDLRALAENHRQTGALVTIAVTPNQWPERYGGIIVDSTGRFHSVGPPRLGGTLVSRRRRADRPPVGVLRICPLDTPAESIGGVYRSLVATNLGAVRAFLCARRFLGRRNAGGLLLPLRSRSASESTVRSRTWGGRPSSIQRARVTDSILWDDVEIGAGATLDRCIVADMVKIPAGVRFQNCAIIQREGELVVADHAVRRERERRRAGLGAPRLRNDGQKIAGVTRDA